VLIETDPAISTLCERPGFVLIDGRRYLADFRVRHADREELVVLSDSVTAEDARPEINLDSTAFSVRSVQRAELAAARAWIDNWQRMLPSIVATRGLLPTSLLEAIERFVFRPQQMMTIERELSTGDPMLVRAAIRPYQVVEFDGHRLDMRLKVVVRDPLGFEHEFGIERIWLLVIIDVK